MSTSLPWIIPLLWVGGVVFGIVAVKRGDGWHGSAALVICAVELCSVVGALIGAAVGVLLVRDDLTGAVDAVKGGLAMLGVMFFGLIGAVLGGLTGVVVSLCAITRARRRGAEREGRPAGRNGRRPDGERQRGLEQGRSD